MLSLKELMHQGTKIFRQCFVSRSIAPNACLFSFLTETTFQIFLALFNLMSRLTFLIGSKSQLFLLKDSHLQTTSAPHLRFCLL